ncbi:MAG: 30S ribosome-binding factor RbfA [Acholeplasmatales bacterium]|nr:30S ribosome-binding factor RbfA [Acholeplasmatales bacterium]
MSLSIKRLESTALRELSIILNREAKNELLKHVTITEVRITNDLSYMTVFYTFYSGKNEDYQAALADSNSYLRTALAKKLNARKMPELIFKLDESLSYGNHIDELLYEYHKKHDNKEGNK